MTTVTYAIGDIHGRLDLLETLLHRVEADAEARGVAARIVFTGDYVDRGRDSFGVIERLIAGPRRAQDRFIALRGNHDQLFVDAVRGGPSVPEWAWLLFWYTLESYGLSRATWRDHAGALHRHADVLAALPLTYDDGTYLFVHAGIRPGVPLQAQAEQDLIWIREDFLGHTGPLPRRVVHGHTIIGDTPVVTPNRISIDTGAFRSGILTAAVITGTTVSFLQAVGEPDRGAIVREALLRATIGRRELPSETLEAHAAYLAGRIDLAEMERLSLIAVEPTGV